MVRALPCHGRGYGFEPRHSRHLAFPSLFRFITSKHGRSSQDWIPSENSRPSWDGISALALLLDILLIPTAPAVGLGNIATAICGVAGSTQIPKWGRGGALRRPGRRAQREATKRVWRRVKPGTICSTRSARARTAQRAVPPIFPKGSLRNWGSKWIRLRDIR